NDGSNEGMIHVSRPIMSTQFHPEAKGGPLDSSFLFDAYLESVEKYHAERCAKDPSLADARPNPLLVDLLSKERVGVAPEKPVKQRNGTPSINAQNIGKGVQADKIPGTAA